MDDAALSRELATAATEAIEARRRLDGMSKGSPEFQRAMLGYLQATMLHLAIVSVAQARQIEALGAELDELREAVARPRLKVH